MYKVIINFLLFFGVCYMVTSSELVDFRVSSNERKPRTIDDGSSPALPPVCVKPGTICGTDCKSIWSCNSDLTAEQIFTCEKNLTCTDEKENAECTTTATFKCSPAASFNFKCTQDGIFPNPARCNEFYYCVNDTTNRIVAFKQTCKGNYAFNPLTRYCDRVLPKEGCGKNVYPVKKCSYPGEMIPIAGPMYAFCKQYDPDNLVLYPFLYTCSNGRTFARSHPC